MSVNDNDKTIDENKINDDLGKASNPAFASPPGNPLDEAVYFIVKKEGDKFNELTDYTGLTTFTETVFPVKITKVDTIDPSTDTDTKKSFMYNNVNYQIEWGTTITITPDVAQQNILKTEFLGPASNPSSNPSNPSNPSTASNPSSTSNPSTASTGGYKKEEVESFFSEPKNLEVFNQYLDASEKKFGENISNLKIAESVVRNNIVSTDLKKCETLLSDAAIYAWNIVDTYKDGATDEQFSKILTAFEILHAVDPSNKNITNSSDSEKSKKIEEINTKLNDKIKEKSIQSITPQKIESKSPNYKANEEVKLDGYTPVVVDRGGSGNCFYYSVWGGLIELGQDKYQKITDALTKFAKTLNTSSDVDFLETFVNPPCVDDCKEKIKFNINIRKLLAYCFLADTENPIYTSYSEMWSNGSGADTLFQAVNHIAYGLRTIIQAKCTEYKNDNNTQFFTLDEFKNILANNVIVDGVFATQIEVDMIKKVFSNCNIILDIYSPKAPIDYTKDKLPTDFEGYSYIYVRHTGGEHYQQIQTTTDLVANSSFIRENIDGESPLWKYVVSSSSGGSRKNKKQKTKGTQRKYYVYKNN